MRSSTIQSAIDDTKTDDGDVLNVSAGSFEKQVVTSKAVTIQGQGEGVTIIKSPATLATAFTTSAANYPVVLAEDVDGVVLQDLTVDGAGLGNANYRFMGIAYYNAGGSVNNVTVKGVRETPLNGNQHGNGIYAYVDNGGSYTLNIDYATVFDFQKNGMALAGTGLTANVSDRTVTGAGAFDVTAQNGIQISYDAAGSIINNTVSNISYTPGNWAASGIIVYGPGGDVTTSGNTVTNCQNGIYYFNGGGLIDDNKVTYDAGAMGATPYWWGITADPGEGESTRVLPQPFEAGGAAVALDSIQAASATSVTAQTATISNNTLDGDGNGDGIDGYAYGGESLTVLITGNTATNFGEAVWLGEASGSELTATVTGNTLTNSGQVGNGVHVEAGVEATIGTTTSGDSNEYLRL